MRYVIHVIFIVIIAGIIFPAQAEATPEKKTKRAVIKMSELHRATFYNDVKKMQRLLDDGADINARASNNVTPLHMAAHEGHVEAAKLLVKNGATPDLLNAQKETALDVAIRKGKANIVDYLFGILNPNKKPLGYTPIKE